MTQAQETQQTRRAVQSTAKVDFTQRAESVARHRRGQVPVLHPVTPFPDTDLLNTGSETI